ncbi:hypothetical protein XM38_038470 [Halomicronema hongdechloris C2206]|uniref:Uncharacterized protein n=1 Tax=Halomicronema hongdechloris C2206 TaxID=1641165 RepID=A0A1Z3HRY3_9CYAN|nr:hypothetical protein XM38_038470 [Halomicronema hongdechloris C2206]
MRCSHDPLLASTEDSLYLLEKIGVQKPFGVLQEEEAQNQVVLFQDLLAHRLVVEYVLSYEQYSIT